MNTNSTMSASFRPGERVRVTQQVVRQGAGMGVGAGEGTFTGTVEGTIVAITQQKTGSWYAHSRDGKLWLERVELRKDDGELIVLNVDQFTHIERAG
jgi:hypothetical protein